MENKPINRHADKLLAKARTHSVFLDDPQVNRYRVISGGSGKVYIVNVFQNGGASCNCDWATKRQDSLIENKGATACSHTIAVFEFIAQGLGKRVSAFNNAEQAQRQHRQTTDLKDGIVLTARRVPRHYRQASFFVIVDRAR